MNTEQTHGRAPRASLMNSKIILPAFGAAFTKLDPRMS